MNISPVNFLRISGINKTYEKKVTPSINYDCVSFSSNYIKRNQRINQAVDLGYEIYFNSVRNQGFNSQKFLSRKEKEAKVLPIDELKKERPDADNYCAYFSCEYDDDILPFDMKLYIGSKPKTCSPMPNLIHSMSLAHEYTHFLQTKDNSDSEFLRELSNGDREYLLLLNGLGGAIFSIFDNNIQAEFVSNVMDINDAMSSAKYGQIAPMRKNITEENLLHANKLKNQEAFNQEFNTLFDIIYDKAFEEINRNSPNVEKRVKDAFMSYLAKDGSLNQLKKDIRKYCAFLAQTEFEAYTTESKLAKKALQIDSSLNIDAFSMYYDMLSDAFNC